jgi:triosephosphate isomerase (TIM)
MRTPLIAGNWKMNTRLSEAVKLVREMRDGLDAIKGVDKLICPPFISLTAVKDVLKGSSIRLGAQNVYFEDKGAFTGEISPPMLAELCEFVIIGHSERRQYFHETGEIVNKKLKAAVKSGLKPILCIGETLAENEARRTDEVIGGQLDVALTGVAPESLTVAYEPIWAIGTGRAATGKQANETIDFIRRMLTGICGESVAQQVRILYGGSVTAENIAEFIAQPEIDGGLVGGASLKPDQFTSIARQAAEIKGR